VDDDSRVNGRALLDAFAETPEGQAVIQAVKHVGAIEIRDSRDQSVAWESLLISDVREIRDLASKRRRTAARDLPRADETTYFISATLAPRLRPVSDERGVGDMPVVAR